MTMITVEHPVTKEMLEVDVTVTTIMQTYNNNLMLNVNANGTVYLEPESFEVIPNPNEPSDEVVV